MDGVAELPRFGRFQATAELGTGAMGTVYRAHDDMLGRAVAIKTLHTHDASVRERFLREARAIGTVRHPNILGIFDAGIAETTPYLVIELAPSGSLKDRLAAGFIAIDEVRAIGIQIAQALAAAHAAGIIHRDVKPANILRTADAWKLADFGIARLPDSQLTITGQFLGSPSYAAPESLRAGEFGPASDVYSLGATLYEALSGATPHGEHDMQSLIRKLEQDPVPLRDRVSVPPAIDHAIMRALSRDPKQRPSAMDLAELLAGDAPVATPKPRRRIRWIAALGAVVVLLILLASRGTPSGSAAAIDGAAPRDEDRDEPVHFVDDRGNPVDPETERRLRDELEHDRGGPPGPPGHPHGHHKRK